MDEQELRALLKENRTFAPSEERCEHMQYRRAREERAGAFGAFARNVA